LARVCKRKINLCKKDNEREQLEKPATEPYKNIGNQKLTKHFQREFRFVDYSYGNFQLHLRHQVLIKVIPCILLLNS